MRIPQPEGTKGSLMWLQRAVERRPDLLMPATLGSIDWASPLRADDFAEYRDRSFLDVLGLHHLGADLAAFWPRGGPQWDGLGRLEDGVVLVEAKAHVREFMTDPSQASDASLKVIRAAFAGVQADLGCNQRAEWTKVFYQYANRWAHLWWLRQSGVSAHLLFVSFLGDETPGIGGPALRETWDAAFRLADYALGLPSRHRLSPFLHHSHPHVRNLC